VSRKDGVPRVLWTLACWRHSRAYRILPSMVTVYSTLKAARIRCKECSIDGRAGKCMYGLKSREPVRLRLQGGKA
jgi:hypothetical protein